MFFNKLGFTRDELCDFFDLYTHIDVDGSGTVSHDEFLNFFRVDGTRALAARIFSKLDLDQSGEIDFFEVAAAARSTRAPTHPVSQPPGPVRRREDFSHPAARRPRRL